MDSPVFSAVSASQFPFHLRISLEKGGENHTAGPEVPPGSLSWYLFVLPGEPSGYRYSGQWFFQDTDGVKDNGGVVL